MEDWDIIFFGFCFFPISVTVILAQEDVKEATVPLTEMKSQDSLWAAYQKQKRWVSGINNGK